MLDDVDQEVESIISQARKSSGRKGWLASLLTKPDHRLSAELYSDAGHRLKFLGRKKEAAECYLKSGDEYLASQCSGCLFFAAEAYVNSYSQSLDRNAMIKACELYCMNNSYSVAANCRKKLLESGEEGQEALESLDFMVMCYDKAGMEMNKMNQVEMKAAVCVRKGLYKEAGDSFWVCSRPLLAFFAYFLGGDEKSMNDTKLRLERKGLELERKAKESKTRNIKLDVEIEKVRADNKVTTAFYGRDRAKDATEAINKYMECNGIRDDHMFLFTKVLERLRPEYDIL